ncbi:hypothetical protein HRR83_004781 [Exophiala dermatitidis]|uniref:Uncharacterized protein n=1 Tax=Exophiala dermatitidis TaxID=5970 RepID=A0AAN6IY11_EXODE|nr:hypothetical protein HRR76_002408 [Exophiala dermatitidis]KAJ4561763.1 hypothetical protein HRR79_007098 [Exophiala dermatitidis]KAJ4597350.1 hypothetical protein HRR83_004781 [Exophiala dermatitidis]KAJ4650979.1 hypothetical protein HRR91_005588 [Exophiala dermatitidis]KAJ4651917.1 hypothetical protein HRR90_005204 [Exophiala dermatitidis]
MANRSSGITFQKDILANDCGLGTTSSVLLPIYKPNMEKCLNGWARQCGQLMTKAWSDQRSRASSEDYPWMAGRRSRLHPHVGRRKTALNRSIRWIKRIQEQG